MITTVSAQQMSHYTNFGWIEFIDFYPLKECLAVQSKILTLVAARTKGMKGSAQKYLFARDLWRDDARLQSLWRGERFSQVAANLSKKEYLCLACDQWIMPGHSFEPLNLLDHLSFQNLFCGCLLSLEGETAGCARFFQPDRLPLFSGSQHLIVYGSGSTVYVHNLHDPNNDWLKRYGYSFGDRLHSAQTACKSSRHLL